MSADNGKPGPGGGDVPARGGEADLAAEIERLRLQLDDVSRQLSDSERRRLEAEASPSGFDEQFAACVDGMLDGVVIDTAIRDETGRIVDFRVAYANEASSRISGVAHDELVGHRILDLFPGRRENGQFDAYVHVVETGEPMVRELGPRSRGSGPSDPDGFGRHFEVSVTKLGDGYVATLHDIVARRRSEDELFRAQQMLRLVLDTIPQRVFWKDTNAVFVGCNAAFARDAGLAAPAEIVGKTDYDLPWRDLAAEYRSTTRAVMSSGSPKLGYDEGRFGPTAARAGYTSARCRCSTRTAAWSGCSALRGHHRPETGRGALRESERFLSDILENIPTMVFVKDASDLRFVA
jgi:PAS domain-containing protein